MHGPIYVRTPRGPKQDPPGRLSGDFRIDRLEKIFVGGKGKKELSCKAVCKVCCTLEAK